MVMEKGVVGFARPRFFTLISSRFLAVLPSLRCSHSTLVPTRDPQPLCQFFVSSFRPTSPPVLALRTSCNVSSMSYLRLCFVPHFLQLCPSLSFVLTYIILCSCYSFLFPRLRPYLLPSFFLSSLLLILLSFVLLYCPFPSFFPLFPSYCQHLLHSHRFLYLLSSFRPSYFPHVSFIGFVYVAALLAFRSLITYCVSSLHLVIALFISLFISLCYFCVLFHPLFRCY